MKSWKYVPESPNTAEKTVTEVIVTRLQYFLVISYWQLNVFCIVLLKFLEFKFVSETIATPAEEPKKISKFVRNFTQGSCKKKF